MNLVSNHLSAHLNTYRDMANFSSMAGEIWFKKSPVFEIAQRAFLSLNACFFVKEVKTLADRCQQKSTFTWDIWGPRIATILNIVAAAASVFYFMGYINFPLFIIACSSRIVPYATQFFQESAYVPLLTKISALSSSAADENRPTSHWPKMSLDPRLSRLSQEVEALLRMERDRSVVCADFRQFLVETTERLNRTIQETQAYLATDFLVSEIGDRDSMEPLINNIRNVVRELEVSILLLAEHRAGSDEFLNQKELIQLRIRQSYRAIINAIDLSQSEERIDRIKTQLQGLLGFDLLVSLTSLVMGIAYVALLISYGGPFPHEGLIYLFFFLHSIYDLWKNYTLQSSELQGKLDEGLRIRTELLSN